MDELEFYLFGAEAAPTIEAYLLVYDETITGSVIATNGRVYMVGPKLPLTDERPNQVWIKTKVQKHGKIEVIN